MDEDRKRLYAIWEAIQRIQHYHLRGVEFFEQSELLQGWIAQHLTIIADAVRQVSPGIKEARPDAPWVKFIQLANTLTHEWSKAEGSVVLTAIERDLPELRRHVEEILLDMNRGGKRETGGVTGQAPG